MWRQPGPEPVLSRRRPPKRRPRLLWLAVAGVVVAAIGGLVAALAVGAGSDDSSTGSPADPAAQARRAAVHPTPSVDRSGLVEGAVPPGDPPEPPPESELWESGGRRFAFPVGDHSDLQDYFGTRRLHGLIHGGIDFGYASDADHAVLAACRGTVAAISSDEFRADQVTVDCGDGWSTVYGFVTAVAVKQGDAVTSGQVLARGDSGHSYLHFELHWQGVAIDPEPYLDLPHPVTPTPEPTSTTTTPTRPLPAGGAATATPPPARGETPAPTSPPPSPGQPTFTPTRPAPTSTPTITPTPTATPTRQPATATATPTRKPVID